MIFSILFLFLTFTNILQDRKIYSNIFTVFVHPRWISLNEIFFKLNKESSVRYNSEASSIFIKPAKDNFGSLYFFLKLETVVVSSSTLLFSPRQARLFISLAEIDLVRVFWKVRREISSKNFDTLFHHPARFFFVSTIRL